MELFALLIGLFLLITLFMPWVNHSWFGFMKSDIDRLQSRIRDLEDKLYGDKEIRSAKTQPIAVFGLLGGLLTPALIGSDEPNAIALFAYLFLLFSGLFVVLTFSQRRGVVLSVLGVAWFYFLGGMFMAQFPNFTKDTLGADENVLALFLVVFSIGIAIGGLLNNSLLKGRVEAVYGTKTPVNHK